MLSIQAIMNKDKEDLKKHYAKYADKENLTGDDKLYLKIIKNIIMGI